MKIIGLTGGIASGKTTVSQMIRTMGIPVICADKLAHLAIKPNTHAFHKIIQTFGSEILNTDGTINRALLGKIVFANPTKREELNQITHPEIVLEIKLQIELLKKEGAPLVVLDIPLLYEGNLHRLCDKVIVVYAPEPIRRKRLKQRNSLSDMEIAQRLASQMPMDIKRKKADYVIDNSGSLEETKKQLELIIIKLNPMINTAP